MKPIFLILAFLFSFHAYGISISQIMKEKSNSQYMITCADPTSSTTSNVNGSGLILGQETQPIIPTGGTVIARGSCSPTQRQIGGGGVWDPNCICSIQMGNKTYSCNGSGFISPSAGYNIPNKPVNCALYSIP